MLTVDLPRDIEARLDLLADKAGRTKAECAQEAILRFLDDAEDAEIAAERLRRPAKRWSLEDLERGRDLER